ncbi:hypothetical protein U9M48_042305 [Paspalum notatum var. saurae]|uniref:Formin-like protein n=1 Tax=Paspalum notatum var. saurae TaxID=547442 RepID=A0AAQ3XF30_PASNO
MKSAAAASAPARATFSISGGKYASLHGSSWGLSLRRRLDERSVPPSLPAAPCLLRGGGGPLSARRSGVEIHLGVDWFGVHFYCAGGAKLHGHDVLTIGSSEINLLWRPCEETLQILSSYTFLHSHEMSLLSRFFYKRPPDGLLEFNDRIYVFDSCFSTEVLPQGMYPIYLNEILTELHEEHVESSFLVINFRDGDKRSQLADILREHNIPIIDYPRHFEGCPVLPLCLIHHFLRVCEHWLSVGNSQNIILLHCERGAWPLLAFLLSCLLIYKKLHGAEHKTLDIIYREAPKGFLQLFSALNPMPSQLRYMQYVARRNISPEWPPMERALSLDCLILRSIPSFDSDNGCRPLVRIFGRNLLGKNASMTNMIFSMPKKKSLRHYRQEDCDVIKIDIQCLVQGDIVLECVHLDLDPEKEVMMFRIMFNTAFIRSNVLMLNSDDVDILWGSKERYPRNFRAEVLFCEIGGISPPRAPTATLNGDMKGGLPIEAFSAVQELFNGVDWIESSDDAAYWLLKEKFQKLILNDMKELSKMQAKVGLQMPLMSPLDSDEEKYSDSVSSADHEKVQHGGNSSDSENIDRDLITEDSESTGRTSYMNHFLLWNFFTMAPDIDLSELESLFSTQVVTSTSEKGAARRGSTISKPEIVHLVDMRRANNCEIMLTKIKMPLPDMISAILALDTSVLDNDQGYNGNKEMLGKCEQFFLELMKVPRVEAKLRVFAFRITFSTQVDELRTNLTTINDATKEVKESLKLRQIMQTILTLGNALNQGTARGSAVGFRLDSLLKLSDTRARNNKMTLMHYLCKLLAEKMPELLDFDKDLIHLEAASKIQLKLLAEEMQAINKGLEKVEQELAASENDGAISIGFRKALKNFLDAAEAEVRSLISLYAEVGRNADSLAQYFGEDPARCPFEQVTSILVIFVNIFKKSRDENARNAEAEKKKLEKEKEKASASAK